MVKIRRLVKQTFQTFLKLVLAEKWLTLIVFAVTIIQLLSRKGARYAFNVPNRYLITQTKKYGHDKKIFLGWNKVFEKLWNSFRILSKRPRYMTDFWIKENDIIRLFECFQLSESTACCQKRRCDRIVALCILLKKRLSYLYRCKGVFQLFGWNSSSFDIYTQFHLSTSPSQSRFMEFIFFTTAIFT